MSFSRHEEIYRPMGGANRLGRPTCGHPSAHRYDEFPAGYSLAGCAPAEPASASPAGGHRAGQSGSSTIEKQRTANRLLTACLTQGDNPSVVSSIHNKGDCLILASDRLGSFGDVFSTKSFGKMFCMNDVPLFAVCADAVQNAGELLPMIAEGWRNVPENLAISRGIANRKHSPI